MNPKTPGNLDPKLKEAYERIMSGTSAVGPAQNTAQVPSPFEQPKAPLNMSQNFPPQPQSQTPIMQTEVINTPQPELNKMEKDITGSPLLKGGNFINQQVSGETKPEEKKKKHGFLSFVLGFGVVAFLIAYSLVWAKVFGIF